LIIFNKISYKNFLSYGNSTVEFDFHSGINRISGINGVGKSCLAEALYFVLFGKTYRRINLPQLVNSINNSDLLVKLWFTIGDTEYIVERGLKPAIFRIYENGNLKALCSTTKSYQEIFEEDILKMNENIFCQITFKSITKNISFLGLPKQDKRKIIENIFDIEIFSTMNKLAATKLDLIKTDLYNCKKEIEFTDMLIEQELANLEHLKNLNKQIQEDSKEKVNEINSEIETLTEENRKYDIGLEKIKIYKDTKIIIEATIEKYRNELKNERERETNYKSTLKLIDDKLKLLNSTCAGCPKINSIMENENPELVNNQLVSVKDTIVLLQSNIKNKQDELIKIEKILANEKYLIGSKQKNQSRIETLNKSIYVELNKEIEIDRTKYIEHTNNRNDLSVKFNELSHKEKHLLAMKTLLSDDGIKAFVIKRYLPYINKLLNTYLQKFNAGILFYFDNEFNEKIGTRHKENFSYFNFSEGQKRRIDLSILFAFIEFAKLKNKKANTNLLILDEISAMLDASGENLLYEVLRDFVNRENKSIIAISHSGNIDPEKIDKLFEVSLIKGFSKLCLIEN
jgi:DNA repair exonuclease SbcCD ATPase subunit